MKRFTTRLERLERRVGPSTEPLVVIWRVVEVYEPGKVADDHGRPARIYSADRQHREYAREHSESEEAFIRRVCEAEADVRADRSAGTRPGWLLIA